MNLHNRVNGKELKERLMASKEPRVTLSFYKYFRFGNPQLIRDHLYLMWDQLNVLGRIYIAHEGINAQISVPDAQWPEFIKSLEHLEFMNGTRLNIAVDKSGKSFFKLKITLRNKIVADGLNDASFDVNDTGTHLSAIEMNQKVQEENTIVVDMRNHYESEVGHFRGAICPDVETFRESLPLIRDMLATERDKNIVMYCTGGIRCEKASAYMKHHGFKNVFQLEGGIIEYTRQAAEQNLENLFVGKNFVFDERLGEKISDDIVAHCHQCGQPADTHVNCANDHCHLLFIQCAECAELYENTCSKLCQEYIHNSAEEQKEAGKNKIFNGSRFGKKRYNPKRNMSL
ncbi:MAG TPA: rhodanese-related sulfurtransferase [Saprospiraceae bacterium]|nr:rhodanese-related sulfurtransferase [Saprospiraceae bacterium]HQW55570.1 rhodanese-related sulfurtransferase [Saprospiraceae bacterium]